MAQLTDDCFAHGGPLMPCDEALTLLRERLVRITEDEVLPLAQCLGRVLTEDVIAPGDVPPHNNAAVDGYAFYFDDLDPHQETTLPLGGRLAAGQAVGGPLPRGTALRIFTGAPLPEGPDTIMMQEDCREEQGRVTLLPGIKRGANLRLAGEDIAAGTRVLSAGRRLRAPDLGQAASAARSHLKVSRPLRVALFSTGDELYEPERPLPRGGIHDSNRYTLIGLLRKIGCEVEDLGILPDRRDVITEALARAAARHDLIMTSGGVSTGDEDHVKQAVETQGVVHAWRLAIKPGRPIALGQIGRVPFIGLPGNPAAVVVTFVMLVRPLISLLMGEEAKPPLSFPVTVEFDYKKKEGRREWVRVFLQRDEAGRAVATKFPREGAGILSSFVECDGLLQLPEELTRLEKGDTADFLPFSELFQ
ncbi:MAG TPA: gephyrin-like molybdotransferase Glp [Kiloniellales bacterium]|nr:gephyrin-like molybdotransferase Glp [Kiloniellales bacterium]